MSNPNSHTSELTACHVVPVQAQAFPFCSAMALSAFVFRAALALGLVCLDTNIFARAYCTAYDAGCSGQQSANCLQERWGHCPKIPVWFGVGCEIAFTTIGLPSNSKDIIPHPDISFGKCVWQV